MVLLTSGRFGRFAEIWIILLYTFYGDVMNRLREIRVAHHMTQQELGELLGVTDATVSKYELCRRDLDPETINRICNHFNCTADYLLCRSDIRSYNLTAQEIALLIAYRAADARAREMVDLALRPFAPDAKKTETA